MRIRELFENNKFDDLDYVKKSDDGNQLDFDLVEDLTFFMNNDDDLYRRHVYPSISKCVSSVNAKKKINPSIFKNAALEAYNTYIKKYPIRELPNSMESKLCEKVCDKMYEEFQKNYKEGKYKD